jgi:Pvc16 N-terminal domain
VIAHALSIVKNELDLHLSSYGVVGSQVELGNVGEISSAGGTNGPTRGKTVLSVVNVLEERTLKNEPNQIRDDVALRVRYVNAPVFLNLAVLVTATHNAYPDALVALSRAVLFFQHRTVFTPANVDPGSLTTNAPVNVLDRLDEFKLVFNLMSPTLEEVNHLWGTLGGKQFPFALYSMRMLEMQFQATHGEGGLITEVIGSFSHTAGR